MLLLECGSLLDCLNIGFLLIGLDTIKGGGGNADELVGSLPAKLKLNTCSENSTTEKTYGISLRAEYAGGGTAKAGWGANGANVMIIQEIKR